MSAVLVVIGLISLIAIMVYLARSIQADGRKEAAFFREELYRQEKESQARRMKNDVIHQIMNAGQATRSQRYRQDLDHRHDS